MSDSLKDHDAMERYCPKLGHAVPFAYCRAAGVELPCRRVVDCWRGKFDVESYLRENWSEEDIQRMLALPADKMTTIIDLVRKAQERTKSD